MSMRARRAAAMAVTGLALMAGSVGCGSGDPDSLVAAGTLIDAEDQSPPILNVLLSDGATAVGQRVVSNIQQNLLTADESGAFVPQLATAVPSGDDLRTGPLRVTFRLQPGARWSDGRTLTSEDVVFTWRTMTDDRNAVASRTGWDQIAGITAGREASGGACPPATCFTVRFRGDYAPWRDIFSVSGGTYILPRHVLRGADFNTVWNTGGIIGSGPFTLESFQPGVRAVLERDPDYWGAGSSAPLERIVFDFLGSPAAALSAVRQGQAQMASPPPDPALIRRARAIDGTTVQAVPSLFFEHIILNTGNPAVSDPRVRRALALAIDRRQIVDVLLDGSVPVLQSVVRPEQLGHDPSFERYAYDPEEAGVRLREAGWARGRNGIFAKDGRELRIPLVFESGNPLRTTTARLIAAQARAAGIAIDPRPLSAERIFGSLLNEGDFVAVMAAFGGGLDPSLTGLLAGDQIPTEENGFSGQNVYRWSDAEADVLMRRSDRQVDDVERAATLVRLQRIIAAEVPLIPLYQQPNSVVHTDALSGVRQNPTQAEVFWNSAEWSLRGAGGG